jgi:3-oxoadipate enol-lactonase
MADAPHTETGFATVNGAKLYYETAGTGRTLVLLHAGQLDQRMWDDQFNVFAQHYHVIRYDARGYGKSDFPADSYSKSRDLYGLLTFLGIEKAALMGVSLGGRVALDFTLEHPEMVDALIPVASGLSGYKFADQPAEAEAQAAYQRGDFAQAAALVTRIWCDGPRRAPDQVDPAVRQRVLAMTLDLFPRPLPEPEPQEVELDHPAISRLKEIQAPTLIIVGDEDVLDILVIADILQKHIRHAETLVIPGAAHMVNMEQPGRVNRAVLEFLH